MEDAVLWQKERQSQMRILAVKSIILYLMYLRSFKNERQLSATELQGRLRQANTPGILEKRYLLRSDMSCFSETPSVSKCAKQKLPLPLDNAESTSLQDEVNAKYRTADLIEDRLKFSALRGICFLMRELKKDVNPVMNDANKSRKGQSCSVVVMSFFHVCC